METGIKRHQRSEHLTVGFQPLERNDRDILDIGGAMFSELDIVPMAAYGWSSNVSGPFAPAFLPQALGHHYYLFTLETILFLPLQGLWRFKHLWSVYHVQTLFRLQRGRDV